jgi:2-hydroxy-3-keto-5-methylthiopentenyl-1-phosphate phosphatase
VWAVLSDFDGTILKNDLPRLALKRFGRAGWDRLDDMFAADEFSLEKIIRKYYSMIAAQSREEITEYIDGFCEFRPGFDLLLRKCRDANIDFTIVSVGLDFCIEHAFARTGLELPRLVCPKSSFVPGKGFTLTFPEHRFPTSRDFKEDWVDYYKSSGRSVVYIGDGMGDFHAASKADEVFAIKGSALDEMCTEREIPHHSITTFAPVNRFISHI